MGYNNSKPTPSQRIILRGAEILSLLEGKPLNDLAQAESAVDTFQDTLRLFPPYREQDDTTSEEEGIRCPDCEAVFSSSIEIEQHYLTKYCRGAAVVVYVMTQNRHVKKGYRVEKKSIPLDSQPFRIPCRKCEEQFTSEEDRKAHEKTHKPENQKCVHCERTCDTLYELNLHYDWHNDMEYRLFRDETSKTNRSRSSGITFSTKHASIATHVTGSSVEATISNTSGGKSMSQKLSWPLKKYAQGDDGELVAISFISAEDLERVYAPNGAFQEFSKSNITVSPTSQLVAIPESDYTGSAYEDAAVSNVDAKNLVTTLCKDRGVHLNKMSINPNNKPSSQNAVSHDTGLSRKKSLLRIMFGQKISRQRSQTSSSPNRGRKLEKKAGIQFSMSNNPKDNAQATNDVGREKTGSIDGRESPALKKQIPGNLSDIASEWGSLEGSQGPFVHIRYHSAGAIINDVSGRQRILSLDRIAQVYLQISEGFSSAAMRTKANALQARAEITLRRGNAEVAISEYHRALNILSKTPGLDVDKLSRAAILHELGQAYMIMNQTGDSEACYLEALGLYKRNFGRDYPTNFAILNDLGILCERDGYATEAAKLYERSLAGRLRVLGQNAPETLSSIQDLATIKISLGDLESALLLFEKAVPTLETVLGLQNENTLNAMDSLCVLYQRLGMKEECRDMSRRILPHCRTTFGLNSPVTRRAVTRCVQDAGNFDFPPVVRDILDNYRHSHVPECLRVLHSLGRAYMDAGLNRDAAEIFEVLFEEFTAVKGVDAPESLDALSALCVAQENLDWLEKAINSYGQLLQIARRTPENHPSRRRMDYAQRRVNELANRRQVLAAERKEWRLSEEWPCTNCKSSTSNLCSTCNIVRFCCETCSNLGARVHLPRCIPSVTFRESKSIATKPGCPLTVQEQALAKIRSKGNGPLMGFTATYTFYLDPRNFTTFRMKFSNAVNSFVLFGADANVQYIILDNAIEESKPAPESPSSTAGTSKSPKLQETQPEIVEWSTPQSQDCIYIPATPQSHSSTTATYLLVAPGKELLKRTVAKRVKARRGGGEQEQFEALEVPNKELIEYSQGLLLSGYPGEAFMYVFEWF